MGRRKKARPDYRFHSSGQAVVTLGAKEYYLGTYDSPKSHARYLELLAVYNANGLRMPDDLETHLKNAPIKVACLTLEFREHAKEKFAANAHRRRHFEKLCETIDDEYGDTPAEEFGPRKLAEIRDLLVVSGNTRSYVNQQIREIIQIFRFGVSRELIDVNVIIRLESLEPLRVGQTKAKESKRRVPAKLDDVRETAAHLSPTLKAMLRIQVATGMRSGEVCAIRPRNIDRSGDEWMYRPDSHKTQHHGVQRAVPIVGDARQVLTPFLLRDADQYCFSPKESAQWYRDQRTANRKTSRRYGNTVGSNRKTNPKRQPGEQYTKDAYRRAIVRAAEKAKVAPWTPHQIRHLVATEVRHALGIEGAQHLLGHTKAAMTEHYAKAKEEKAIEAARYAPKLG